jgi:hypothetical protein
VRDRDRIEELVLVKFTGEQPGEQRVCWRVVGRWDKKGGAERSGRDGMRPVRGKRTWQGPW